MKKYCILYAYKLLVSMVLLLISYISIAQVPDFSVNNNSQCFAGNSFVFTNHSSPGASAYLWNFGDGSTSSDSCPVKIYTTYGNYSVQLMATYNNINYYINKTIEVNPEPVCGFNYYAATNTGNSYSFQSTSYINSGYANYLWNFGDSSTATGTNPLHTFGHNGNFTVSISALSDKGCTCSNTQNIQVTVSVPSVVGNMGFNVNTVTQCLSGNSFYFNNTSNNISGATYSWDFGDGTVSAVFSPTHTYINPGTFVVSLKANVSGMDFYKTQTVIVLPKTSISISSSDTTICKGKSVTFTTNVFNVNNSIVYQWQLNNINVGNNAASFTCNTLSTGDVVTCIIQAENACQVTETDTSNAILIKVLTVAAPSVMITTKSTVICAASNVTITADTSNISGFLNYEFKVNGSTMQNSSSNTFTTRSLTDSAIVTVSLTAGNACYPSAYITSPNLIFRYNTTLGNIWTGNVDSNFTNKQNWCLATLPSNAFIQTTSSNRYPVLASDITVNNLTINSGTSIIIGAHTLTINGTISGAGTLIGSRLSNLIINSTTTDTLLLGTSIPGDSISNSLNNLTINNGIVTLGSALNIHGIINVASGKFDAAGKCITFMSDSLGTASLDKVNDGIHGTLVNATNITIQRYHANKRAWVLMGAPLTTASAFSGFKGDIYSNWQKNTFISGPVTTGGLDPGITSSYSILSWAGTAWANISNTKGNNSLFGNATGDSSASIPYFLFIRGDRTITPSMSTSSTSVTLFAKGALQTGTKYVPLPTGYTMAIVANPYPAPLDLTQFVNDNPTLSIGGITTIYYWDPNLSSTGGYTTAIYNGSSWQYSSLNTTNTLPGFIQSGQAFFVTRNNAANTVVFKESQKSTAQSSNSVFGNNITSSVSINLTKGSTLIDGVLTQYNNTYSNAVITPGEDAAKMWSNEEGISILRNNNNLSIESRPDIGIDDTTYLFVRNLLASTNYSLSITGYNMPANINGYLIDNYSNTKTELSMESNTQISFSTDSSLASAASARFMIVYENKVPLPVQEINIKASKKGNAALIEWNVVNAADAAGYVVEKATDNNIFSAIYNTLATSNINYSYTDFHAAGGDNYYRIKAMAKDGTTTYSAIVKLSFTDITNNQFAVYPNPARTEITVSTSYSNSLLNITDISGKTIISKNLDATETRLNIDKLRAGIYMVILHTDEGNKTSRLIVE